MKYFYFTAGGILVFSSAVGFLYFVMFGYQVTWSQWLADLMIGTVGAVFLTISDTKEKK